MIETILFYIFGGIALIAAISTVAQKKVFYSAISLVVCLCSLAVLYLMLEAPFIAAVQVVVYAGAVMVLFLFVIMLLDPASAAPVRGQKKYLAYIAAALGAISFAVLVSILTSRSPSLSSMDAIPQGAATISMRQFGQTLFNEFLFPFEMTSVLILVAIIGVVVLARRRH
jgi:NADH-quinone oxidoreductase subunit J